MFVVFFEKYVLVDPDVNAERVTMIVKDWELDENELSELTNTSILRSGSISYPAFSSALVFYSIVAYQPVLLIKILSLNFENEVNFFFFSIYPIFFVLSGMLYFRLPNRINDSTIIIIGALISSVCNMMMGLYLSGSIKGYDAIH